MKRRAVAAAVVGSAAGVYMLGAGPWQLRWGATDEELDATLAGDDLIAKPDLMATRATTVHAGTDQIWPWIAQVGRPEIVGRRFGGLYSGGAAR